MINVLDPGAGSPEETWEILALGLMLHIQPLEEAKTEVWLDPSADGRMEEVRSR